MQHRLRINPRIDHAFTLIELLVTVSIIIVLIGVSLPSISAMTRWAKTTSGVNTIHVAVTAARAFARRDLSGQFEDVDDGTIGQQSGVYSGVAMLFTPSNEIRLVQNTPRALSTGGSLLERMATERNGFADLPDRDYIKIDPDVGMVGIVRNGYQETILFAPPFAVRFDIEGRLVQGQDLDYHVYYDANYDGEFRTSGTAAGSGYERRRWYGQTVIPEAYDPYLWDPRSEKHDSSNFNTALDKMELPFEEIETVVGVITFSKPELTQAGFDLTSVTSNTIFELNTSARDWILENGRVLFFNRNSGVLLRQRLRN